MSTEATTLAPVDPGFTVRRRQAEIIELHHGPEYAVFTIDAQDHRRYFALTIESSFGGYAYAWSHPGDDFYGFLAHLSVDYVRGKMIGSEREEWDEDETQKELKAEVDKMLAEGRCTEEQAEEERAAIASIEDALSFWDWARESELFKGYAHHEFIRTCGGPRFRDFTALYKLFWAELGKELTAIAAERAVAKQQAEAKP